MNVGESSQRSARRAPLVVGALVVVLAVALWVTAGPDEPPPSADASRGTAAAPAPPQAAPRASAPATPARADRYDPARVIASGETIVIERTSLPTDAPVVLQLAVPAPPAGIGALEVRLLAEGVEPLELSGALVGEARERLQVDVADWPWPARTIVEVKTRERSHLPLRRYAVEVR